jgi:hypothetical protein
MTTRSCVPDPINSAPTGMDRISFPALQASDFSEHQREPAAALVEHHLSELSAPAGSVRNIGLSLRATATSVLCSTAR